MIAKAGRVNRLEIMDGQDLRPGELRGALSFLEMANRRFGGHALVLEKLDGWSARWSGNVSILDVGTGGGDLPKAIATWARRKRLAVRITGIDAAAEAAAEAARTCRDWPEISIECADLFDLGKRRFDYVIASLFLHHCPGDSAERALAAMDRAAKRGVIISDLLRSTLSWMAVGTLSWIAGNRVVRHDGPLSVRRSFTVDELRSMAANMGLHHLYAGTEPWGRVSLSGEKQ